MSLPKTRRILRSSEFKAIYGAGARLTSRYFVAFCLRGSEGGPSRIGFTVPRAVGKAVIRNRLKRRMREAVCSKLELLPENWAVVINPRRGVLKAPFEELCFEVGRVFGRCKQS